MRGTAIGKGTAIKKCKVICLIFLSLTTAILTSCSAPISDFGRLDESRTASITQPRAVIIDFEQRKVFFSPLNHSEDEQRLYLINFLLKKSSYKIINDKPIEGEKLFDYFNDHDIYSTKDRYISVSLEIDKHMSELPEFEMLAIRIMAADHGRSQLSNEIIGTKYRRAIEFRHEENLTLIKDMSDYMRVLYESYDYIKNQGRVVEPHIDSHRLDNKLDNFNRQIKRLESIHQHN